jgi:hypothetical protein
MPPTNPFETLRLDPTAGEEQVVQQAGRLRQLAADEEEQTRIRQAVQELTASADARRLHALLTHPRPGYEQTLLDRFVARYRQPPPSGEPVLFTPVFDSAEFRELVRELIREELQLRPSAFDELPLTENPEEIQRQIAEILWQSLVYAPEPPRAE